MGMQSTEQPGLEVVASSGLILHPKDNTADLPIYAGNGTDAPIPVKTDQWPSANAPIVATPSRTICGLRRRTFWIAFLVAVVVVAAAVGGGVGGSLAKHGQSPEGGSSDADLLVTAPTTTSSPLSTDPTTSTTSTATATSTTNTPSPSATCPAMNGTTITVKETTYIRLCDTDLCSRSTGCTSFTIADKNLQKFTTDSLEACIEQCEVYNSVIKGDICKGVSWDEYAPPGADRLRRCFLKNNTTARASAPSGWTIVSAVAEGK